jgi:hypothetical protein
MISTGSNSANAIAQAVLPLPVGPAIQIGVRVIFKMGSESIYFPTPGTKVGLVRWTFPHCKNGVVKMGSESIYSEAFPHCASLHAGYGVRVTDFGESS